MYDADSTAHGDARGAGADAGTDAADAGRLPDERIPRSRSSYRKRERPTWEVSLRSMEAGLRKAVEASSVLALQELRDVQNKQWQGVYARVSRRLIVQKTETLLEVGAQHKVARVTVVPLEEWLDRGRVRTHIEDLRQREAEEEEQNQHQTNNTIYNHIEEMIKKERELEIMEQQRLSEKSSVRKVQAKLRSLESEGSVSATAHLMDDEAKAAARLQQLRLTPEQLLEERMARIDARRRELPSIRRTNKG